MSREWVSQKDARWVMRCDTDGCQVELGPYGESRDSVPDLSVFAAAGWSIARVYGDRCPACVARRGALIPGGQPNNLHPAYAPQPVGRGG